VKLLSNLTMNHFRAAYGIFLLIVVSILTVHLALGKVEEETSYGLMPLIVALASALGGYSTWLFGSREDDRRDPPEAKKNGTA
jgi:membrane protein YqaA with SNARE-associated domain